MTRLRIPTILLAFLVLFGVACNDTVTPTEVPAFVSSTPAPTPIPQPASMSGFVLEYYGGPNVGATLECQGKTTTTVSGGAYDLTGVMSGTSTVTVRWREEGTDTIQDFEVLLKPGPNQIDLRTGP